MNNDVVVTALVRANLANGFTGALDVNAVVPEITELHDGQSAHSR